MFIQCFIDGACRNQGTNLARRAAAAVVIFKSGKEIVRFARGLGDRSNNEAEYEALINALLILTMQDLPAPTIYSDSAVVVNHTTGRWECKSESLLPYYMTVQEIRNEYSFNIIQVPRSKVFLPDELCNRFLDEQEARERALLSRKRVVSE